ncbi:hypothetical protein JMJ35_008410 [Cladonia borealis]|uniref:Uncharacterized protein n=1 Tax=Cladonia borealis TaxID=184061 RepID=A0AA39V2S8_9LECA|nr:hypothetical protein JMJ35_008410 [Cladonia borealis]
MTRQDPRHLQNFDPKTFWPSVAAQSDSLSIYPNSSVSNIAPRRPSLPHSESYIERQRLRNKTIIWVISISFFVVIVILIALFAWLGAHNWFKSEDD